MYKLVYRVAVIIYSGMNRDLLNVFELSSFNFFNFVFFAVVAIRLRQCLRLCVRVCVCVQIFSRGKYLHNTKLPVLRRHFRFWNMTSGSRWFLSHHTKCLVSHFPKTSYIFIKVFFFQKRECVPYLFIL